MRGTEGTDTVPINRELKENTERYDVPTLQTQVGQRKRTRTCIRPHRQRHCPGLLLSKEGECGPFLRKGKSKYCVFMNKHGKKTVNKETWAPVGTGVGRWVADKLAGEGGGARLPSGIPLPSISTVWAVHLHHLCI